MDQIDDSMRNQIAALLRVANFTRCFKEDNVPCKIEEGLFLGSVAAAYNMDALKSLNITHILTVASSVKPAHSNDFVYKIIPAKRQGGGVLVHCFVGKSRSVTIVVSYLMKKHGMSVSQALELVKSKRPLAAPNSGFIQQLQELERSLQANQEQMKDNE
ncbi:dual specificity protein phosphatase 1-like isoform X3 [Herrania umbratica]|uniref:protein-tyrosine-phosphatase n=1 Tax=Herrania umbratica TaxID=108875 RepID=A0A6J1AY34_9ROSI|nr:dual specificity protein phosphatase 1-like isoform X3 [Herrania umbratica]